MNDPLAPIFKALSDPTRRGLLDLLKGGPVTTGALSEHFSLSRYGVMKHLSILESAGLITVQRRGRERWNFLNAVPLQAVYDRWLGPYSAHWAQSLAGLERAATKETPMSTTEEAAPVVDLNTLNLRLQTTIAASPETVFEALTNDMGHWWGAPYLRDHERAVDVVLEPYPGGKLREVWSEGEGAIWGEVSRIGAPRVLELTGRMGMTGPVYAVVTFELEACDSGTLVTLTHQAVGDVDAETESGYQDGWADLLEKRLKSYVETGHKSGVRAAD